MLHSVASLILIILAWVIVAITIFEDQKIIDELCDKNIQLIKDSIAKTEKEIQLKKIMINAKETKEFWIETYEKLERELFK